MWIQNLKLTVIARYQLSREPGEHTHARHPSDTTLYDLQARTYAMQGRLIEQHRAQAYSYAWQGNLYAAIEQLELAKLAGGSFYQLSTIESELRELRELLDARGKQ